jgi:intracellular sulfur oxidation DsrE/DsrF family protein
MEFPDRCGRILSSNFQCAIVDSRVAELREQGLDVTVCSAVDEAWYIKGDGLFSGYIASGTELLALKSANRLNIHGIKSLV